MKLRNKKTGEVVDLSIFGIALSIRKTEQPRAYYSIAELNEEWEDYESAEPLIKDEKIRKTVRAWAEANNFTKLKFGEWAENHWFLRAENEDGHKFDIDFFDVASRNLPKYVYGAYYTIDGLCGEDEE